MKATINEVGDLRISPETELELYALRKWTEEFMSTSPKEYNPPLIIDNQILLLMYKVTYMSLRGVVKQVQAGGDTPEQARAIVEDIYKDCAKTLFVTNVYTGEVVG